MKYRLIFVALLTLVLLPYLSAQQSYYHLQDDADFLKGMELLEKEKYSTAQKFFESSFNKYSESNTELRTLSQYYIALCAVRMFNEDAEFFTYTFVNDNPESPLVNLATFNLAGYFYARKKWGEAIKYYLKSDADLLAKDEWSEYYFKLGYAYFSKNDFEKAKPSFYRIIDVDTKYTPPALYYYSHIHYYEKNYQTALNGFLRLTSDKTFGPIAPYYIVQIYYMQEKYKEIIDFVPGIIANVTDKRLAEVSRITAESYSQLAQYKESLPYYQTYLDSADFVSKEDKYQAGYAFYKAADFARAIELFGSISSTDSQLGQNAAYYLADCYLQSNDKQKARMAFHSASAMKYDPVIKQDALFNYALLTYELSTDPFNEAIRAFEEFIKLYPESKRIDEAYRYLVQSYLNARNYRLALESLEKSNLRSDDMKKAYQRIAFYRGVELFNNLDYARAIQYFDKSLKYSGQNRTLAAKALYWIGEANYKLGDYNKSIANYNSFRNASVAFTAEEYANIDYNIGYGLFKLKDYPKATDAFRKFITNAPSALNKEKGDAYNRVGDCFFAQTNYASAIDYYGKAAATPGADVEYALLQRGICEGLVNKDEQKVITLRQLVTEYPKSLFADDALFEIAQSQIKLHKTEDAISNLKRIIADYPQSNLAANANVQLGILYYNSDNDDAAIKYYKETVARYPGSEAAQDALFGLKNIYIDKNQVDDYFAFVKGLGGKAPVITTNEQDSLSYISAEKIYMTGNCDKSSKAFEGYLAGYPDGKYALNAQFYKGDCNYRKKEFDKALESFSYVLQKPSNAFTEQALLGSARIETEDKDYTKAAAHYTRLYTEFPTPANKKEAGIALVRSYYFLANYGEALKWAREVLTISKIGPETEREATYIAARALQETGRDMLAIEEYKKLAIEVMSSEGAEAKFRLAELYFNRKEYTESEKVILDFSEKTSPHDYWIARSFILWADIFVEKKDYFQAVQTLQSIIDYYQNTEDGILRMAKEKKSMIIKVQEANEQPKAHKDVEINIE